MKTKKHLLILLVLSVFMIFGTGCILNKKQPRNRGELITSKPQGKIDPTEMDKFTGAGSAKKQVPGQVKKNKKRK